MEITLFAPPTTLNEAIDDVSMRFLVNLPPEELESVERLFFQLQQAHWYYLDFFVQPGSTLPYLSFRDFTRTLFERCPMLAGHSHQYEEMRQQFKEYMWSIPVYGVILLNRTMDRVLMIRPWKGKHWVFPKGKINEGESEVQCAAREGLEEVGYDASHLLAADQFLSLRTGAKPMKFFIGVGAPDDGSVMYAPQTRMEVSEIGWFDVASLPDNSGVKGASKFWTMLALMKPLRAWIAKARGAAAGGKKKKAAAATATTAGAGSPGPLAGAPSKPKPRATTGVGAAAGLAAAPAAAAAAATAKPKGAGAAPGSAKSKAAGAAAGAVVCGGASGDVGGRSGGAYPGGELGSGYGGGGSGVDGLDLLTSLEGGAAGCDGGGAHPKGWSVSDMFAANEKLLGKRFVYDGNPHRFGDADQRAVPTAPPAAAPAAAAATGPRKAGPAATAAAAKAASGGAGASGASGAGVGARGSATPAPPRAPAVAGAAAGAGGSDTAPAGAGGAGKPTPAPRKKRQQPAEAAAGTAGAGGVSAGRVAASPRSRSGGLDRLGRSSERGSGGVPADGAAEDGVGRGSGGSESQHGDSGPLALPQSLSAPFTFNMGAILAAMDLGLGVGVGFGAEAGEGHGTRAGSSSGADDGGAKPERRRRKRRKSAGGAADADGGNGDGDGAGDGACDGRIER
jgi:mRNA-decapping enzyme subunit 2